jgi:hypothetical protein
MRGSEGPRYALTGVLEEDQERELSSVSRQADKQDGVAPDDQGEPVIPGVT